MQRILNIIILCAYYCSLNSRLKFNSHAAVFEDGHHCCCSYCQGPALGNTLMGPHKHVGVHFLPTFLHPVSVQNSSSLALLPSTMWEWSQRLSVHATPSFETSLPQELLETNSYFSELCSLRVSLDSFVIKRRFFNGRYWLNSFM